MSDTRKMKFGLIEIKPEYVTGWREWGAKLMGEYKGEALETLREEGVFYERVSLQEIDGRFFLIYLTEGDFLPANLDRKLNRDHKQLLVDSTLQKISAENLYHLEREKE